MVLLFFWQSYNECRSLPDSALCINCSVMVSYDAETDRKAEACTLADRFVV